MVINASGRVPGWAWRLVAGATSAGLFAALCWWAGTVEARVTNHAEKIAELRTHQAIMDERLRHIKQTTDATAVQVQAMYALFLETGLLTASEMEKK